MCGIAGELAFHGAAPVARERVDAMRDSMAHRGPDGAGTWVSEDGAVGLGHRRLAVIDLSDAAAQPMAGGDGRLRLVFNGEIYNHGELRRELEREGRRRWATDHSDTEVILHAYEAWGMDMLHRFRGMWAFALWDDRRRELWLARDRVGVKPLYYAPHPGGLVFASEIRALLRHPALPRAVDEAALYHYLSFLATPGPDTLFAGVRKLPGGCLLRVDAEGRVEERRWWDVWDHARPLRGASDAELAERVLHELTEAVRLRRVSDVPVGVFLSGGIDSSANAALFSADRAGPVKTFSIGYAGDHPSAPDELGHARRVAAALGTEHHERRLTEDDLVGFLPEMVRLQDEPLADPVCVPVHFLARMARAEGVVVAQVGEGADELFWGYPGWKRALELERWNALPVPAAVKRAGLLALRAAGKGRSHPYELLRRGAAGLPLFWGGAEAFGEVRKRSLLSPALLGRLPAGLTSWEAVRPVRERFLQAAWEPSPLHWMSYLDLRMRLPELLLMRVDKMCMGAGVEGRVPFLDHRLVELAFSIPAAAKTRGGDLKHLLKSAVRGVVPDEVLRRPKQGFGVPVQEWFRGRLGRVAREELERFCRDTDFLDVREVRRTLDRGDARGAWYLLNLALWWREHLA